MNAMPDALYNFLFLNPLSSVNILSFLRSLVNNNSKKKKKNVSECSARVHNGSREEASARPLFLSISCPSTYSTREDPR
jgi:hypothetical protein